jgi:phage terminase large subunit
MPTIQIPNNWKPRYYQRPLWKYLEQGGKRAVGLCHRRWGKDDLVLHATATKIIEKPATYWHMLPQASQARRAIWLAVNPNTGRRRIDEAFPKEIRERTNDNEMFIEFKNGAFWHVVGSDNYNSLVGSPPYGVVFSEWALANPQAWAYIEPILIENGGWAAFIYTSRGKNHGYKLAQLAKASENWYFCDQSVDDTDVFEEEGLAQARESLVALYGEDMGNQLFRQEYYNSFEGGLVGAYYATELQEAENEGRITTVPYEPGRPVSVYMDLGNAPSLAMWFGQYVGMEPHVIDYEAPMATGIDPIVKILKDKRYNYKEIVLPHDGGHAQMGDKLGREYSEILEEASGIPCRVLDKTAVLPGRTAAFALIRKMWMDEENCSDGLDALYSYRQKWDEKKMMFVEVHDWASHPADGFRYMAVDMEPDRPHVNYTVKRAMR